MIRFEKLELVDDPLFGTATLDFTSGLTVVYGLNKSSPHSRNGNAAGKSYLLGLVPEIIWGTPVVGTRADRQTEGTRELHLSIGKNKYVFQAQGTTLKVLENGKPKFRSVTETRKWVKTLPLSEQDFEGLYYLDSRRPHPLVMGTSSARNAYLTRFFGLDKLDARKKVIAAALASTKVQAAKAEELDKALSVLEEHRPKGSRKELRESLKETETRLAKLLKVQKKARQVQRALDFKDSVARALKACATFLDLDSPQAFDEDRWHETIKELESALEEDREQLGHARSWAAYQERVKAYDEAVKDVPKKLRNLGAEDRERYKRAYDQYQRLRARREDLPEKAPSKPSAVEPVDERALKAAALQVSKLDEELAHSEKFGEGQCPTCGSSVKARPTSRVRKELVAAERKLEALEEQESEYKHYLRKLEDYKDRVKALRALKKQQEEIGEQLKKLAPRAKVWSTLRDIPEPLPPYKGRKLQLQVTENLVELGRAKIEAMRSLAPGLHLLNIARTEKAPKDVSEAVGKLTNRVAQIKARLEALETYRRHKKRLEEERESVEDKLGDVPALKVLSQVYADRGVKKMAIEAASTLLSDQLNKHASLIFPEDYRFSVKWERAQLSILCTRRYGKRRVTTDVRKLSGAESRLFTYLLVFCQLQFIPAANRSSLMVLDEPTTNMHEETADAFSELLKILQTVVPSIVVITPHPTEHYEQARRLTVVKTRGKSRIVENHPNSL